MSIHHSIHTITSGSIGVLQVKKPVLALVAIGTNHIEFAVASTLYLGEMNVYARSIIGYQYVLQVIRQLSGYTVCGTTSQPRQQHKLTLQTRGLLLHRAKTQLQ